MTSPKPSASPWTASNENDAGVARTKDAGCGEMNEAVSTASFVLFCFNELVDNALSLLYCLLVPCYLPTTSTSSSHCLAKKIENDQGVYVTCRLTPPLCPRATPKPMRRHRVPHILPRNPLFSHDRARNDTEAAYSTTPISCPCHQ